MPLLYRFMLDTGKDERRGAEQAIEVDRLANVVLYLG